MPRPLRGVLAGQPLADAVLEGRGRRGDIGSGSGRTSTWAAPELLDAPLAGRDGPSDRGGTVGRQVLRPGRQGVKAVNVAPETPYDGTTRVLPTTASPVSSVPALSPVARKSRPATDHTDSPVTASTA